MTGWQGAYNSFNIPMEKNHENSANITSYHLYRLDKHKIDGPWQLAMYNDFSVPANQYIAKFGLLEGDKEAQTKLTEYFETEFKEMSTKLDGFDDLVRLIHPVNSEKYDLIWGRTRERFYQGSYEIRLANLEGLATEMTTQLVPDGAAAVLAYKADIIAKHKTQQDRMDAVNIDLQAMNQLRKILIKKLHKNKGGLIFNFGDYDDCQRRVNSYFPLNLLGDRSLKGHYQLIVPKSNFRKICIHTWKLGEKVHIEAVGADLWISTAENADGPITSGYHIAAGTSITIDPLLLGDLTKKYVIATNVSLTDSCDLIFNIIKP